MSGFMPIYVWLMIFSGLVFFNSVYAVDAKNQKDQRKLVQKIIADLEGYQVKLEKLGKDSQDLDIKTQTEFEYYKELMQDLEKDFAESKKNIQSLEGIVAEFESKHRDYAKQRKELLDVLSTLTSGLDDARLKTSGLDKQKSLIEENSIRLYEVLVDIRARYGYLFAELKKLEQQQSDFVEKSVQQDQQQGNHTSFGPLVLKDLFFISFIFFIPLAFALRNNSGAFLDVALIATTSAVLGYILLGFGLKYGESSTGWISFSNPLLSHLVPIGTTDLTPELITELLHKMGFILLPVLIVACTVNQQFSGILHIIFSFLVSALLIPIFGHWVWSHNGWLAAQGFIDSMGSVVINMVPAWFACMILYRRRSIWIQPKNVQISAYSTASALLLLIGWFGFVLNIPSQSDDKIFSILLNILLAASMGGLCSFAYHAFFESNAVSRSHRLTGGFVAGLVSIAACVDSVAFPEALVIGAVAGILHNVAITLLQKTVLQPAWQAPAAHLVAIHAMGGLWGAVAVALFGSAGSFGALNSGQLMVQLQGIGVALAYSTLFGLLLGKLPFSSRPSSQKPDNLSPQVVKNSPVQA